MSEAPASPSTTRDYRATVFLPKTEFPMRANLPAREPEILERWERLDIYRRLREAAKGREKFILHDGPPYANGHLHMGTALNKILKDVVNRSQQMLGKDAAYVPGWDCHGLPIEWQIEQRYRRPARTRTRCRRPSSGASVASSPSTGSTSSARSSSAWAWSATGSIPTPPWRIRPRPGSSASSPSSCCRASSIAARSR